MIDSGTDSCPSILPRSFRFLMVAGAAVVLSALPAVAQYPDDDGPFRRIATVPVFLNTDVDSETVAEIVAADESGELLIYTDGAGDNVGFIDISNPAEPEVDGIVAVGGEPTSVAVADDYALVAVNTSADFIDTSGRLHVVELDTRTIVRTFDLGGQPDSIAVSPDGRYAAVAIENERDEDLGDGAPPQAPAGFLTIVDLVDEVAAWALRNVDLTGVATLFPDDPEPEFVDINAANQVAITLQENNHIIIVDLPTGHIVSDFSAGTVDLTQVDVVEEGLIDLTGTLTDVPREPDAVAWTSLTTLATADEGDLDGGSRGFTIFDAQGQVLYTSGNEMEHLVARLGHYPDERSENKGNEPEAVEVGHYDDADPYLFVGSERSSVVAVFELEDGADPELVQVLPSGVAPEGLLALPQRDLFVVACEEDNRGDKIRASVVIYQRFRGGSDYPKVISEDRADGTPIPWAALSGLATDPVDADTVYTIHDSFYGKSRIYAMDISDRPAVIRSEIELNDRNGVLAQTLADLKTALPGTDSFDPADLINDDGTVHLDPEGVVASGDGSLWIASEGSGNLVGGVSDPDNRPFKSPNLILEVDPADGTITTAVAPPVELLQNQLRFGFEGVTVDANGVIYVAFQRAWPAAGDPADHARIGRYAEGLWTFAFYPLDTPESPNGGWVGLSDITYLGDDTLAILERDNQGGPDAAVKRIYTVSLAGVNFLDQNQAPNFNAFTKTLTTDLMADGYLGLTAGPVLEKWEGLAALPDGTALIVNDNDGVDDSSGETQLLRIQGLFSENGPGGGDTVDPFVCVNTDTTVCLAGGRFQVSGTWETASGETADARIAEAGTGDSALLWFFDEENWEVLLKVLDGCSTNNHYWVFSAATTDVGYTLRVVDSQTGAVKTYENSVGNAAAAVTDTGAFIGCP